MAATLWRCPSASDNSLLSMLEALYSTICDRDVSGTSVPAAMGSVESDPKFCIVYAAWQSLSLGFLTGWFSSYLTGDASNWPWMGGSECKAWALWLWSLSQCNRDLKKYHIHQPQNTLSHSFRSLMCIFCLLLIDHCVHAILLVFHYSHLRDVSEGVFLNLQCIYYLWWTFGKWR